MTKSAGLLVSWHVREYGTCTCDDVFEVKGEATWPIRCLGHEVGLNLMAVVGVDSTPERGIACCYTQASCENEGFAAVPELVMIL